MTLNDFVQGVKDGTLKAETGGVEGEVLVTRLAPLDASDVEGCTAEAYHLEVFDPSKVSWDKAVAQMREALNEGEPA